MSEHDGPPTLISDEWQELSEPRRVAADPEPSDQGILPVADGQASPAEPSEPATDQPPAEEPPTEPLPPDHLTSIEAELRTLRAQTVHVNEILDRMHAENERLRRGESEQILMPLFRDLIKLAEDWTSIGTSWESKDTATPAEVARTCRDIADDATLILERHGVEPVNPEAGTAIERKRHRVVATVGAETPELDGTVAEVRKVGYTYGERILKFADVVGAKRAPEEPS